MANYKSNYTGAEIDSAVNKANIIPQPSEENVGKVLSIVETGKGEYGYRFITQQVNITFVISIIGIECDLSYDQVRELISVDSSYANILLCGFGEEADVQYRATGIRIRANVIEFTFIYPGSGNTNLVTKILSYNADGTITSVDYVCAYSGR